MDERFTDRARHIVQLAKEESVRGHQEYIGTEHLLIGLIREGGPAAQILTNGGRDLTRIRTEIERLIPPGDALPTNDPLPMTPRAKQVLEYARDEAARLNHDDAEPEHLLLGMLRDDESLATRVLTNLGLRMEEVREQVLLSFAARDVPQRIAQTRATAPSSREKLEILEARIVAPRVIRDAGQGRHVLAVDIGNSQIKLGEFNLPVANRSEPVSGASIPAPSATCELPIDHETGRFRLRELAAWCEQRLTTETHWSIGSVHRAAAKYLSSVIGAWSRSHQATWPVRLLTYQDLPLAIHVAEPSRVGIDRLLAAVAANRLRAPDRAAVVVDLGTAVTVDLVDAGGAFAGGAILPGLGMAGRALADHTDALPHVVLEHSVAPPSPLGKSTQAAIEAGLYWGAVGAVGELISQLSARQSARPDVFVTGGAGQLLLDSLSHNHPARYEPHLVLAGIALVEPQWSVDP